MMCRLWIFSLLMLGITEFVSADDVAEPPILVLDTQSFAGAEIRSLAFSHDDKLLAVGGGKEVRIWSIDDGRLLHTLRGYREPDGFNIGNINGLAFSQDNRYLVVGVTDNTELGSTRIIDLHQPNSPLQLLPGHTGCTLGAANTPDGRYFATFGCAGLLEVFDVDLSTGRSNLVMNAPLAFHQQKNGQSPDYFGFPFDDDWILLRDRGYEFVGSRRQNRLVTNSNEWPEWLRSFIAWESGLVPPRAFPQAKFTSNVELRLGASPAYIRGGMTRGTSNYWVGIWDTVAAEPKVIYAKHRYVPKHVTLSSSRRIAASADLFGEVHVWDAKNGRQKIVFRPQNRELFGVRWINDHVVQISDEFFSRDDYFPNHYGPFTWEFDIESRRLVQIPKRIPLPRDREELRSPTLTAGRLVADYEKNRLTLGTLEAAVASFSNDRPMAFAGLPSNPGEPKERMNVVIGTEKGSLIQKDSLAENPYSKAPASTNADWLTTRVFRGHTGFISSTAISPNGKLLATSSTDGTVRFWSLAKPRPSGDLPVYAVGNRVESSWGDGSNLFHKGDSILTVDGRSFYERKRKIAKGEFVPGQTVQVTYERPNESGLPDRLTATVELESTPAIDEPLATLFMARTGEWIFWTPSGFYETSPSGEQFVGWHLNQGRTLPARFFDVGQFRAKFYQPGTVSNHVLKANTATNRNDAPVPPAVARFEVPFENPGDLEKLLPPEVRIIEPLPGSVLLEGTVPVRLEVIASSELREQLVSVQVNGNRAREIPKAGKPTATAGLGNLVRTEYTLNLDLISGKNKITARAKHDRGESNAASCLVECKADSKPSEKSRLFVLAVGVAKYQQKSLNLNACAKDAKDFAAAFSQQKGLLFDDVEPRVLCDEEATVANIKDAQDWIVQQATRPNDRVIVFLSSHGIYSNQIWHMLPYDYDETRPRKTSLQFHEIKSWLEDEIKANAILFVDSCHASGVLGHKTKGARPAAWQGAGKLVLSSSLPDEESIELDDNGAFTKAILQALNTPAEADRLPTDGLLTFDELAAFVKNTVPKLTADQQHPTAYSSGTSSNVVVFKYR